MRFLHELAGPALLAGFPTTPTGPIRTIAGPGPQHAPSLLEAHPGTYWTARATHDPTANSPLLFRQDLLEKLEAAAGRPNSSLPLSPLSSSSTSSSSSSSSPSPLSSPLPSDRAVLAKWMLAKSMGCPHTFALRKQSLQLERDDERARRRRPSQAPLSPGSSDGVMGGLTGGLTGGVVTGDVVTDDDVVDDFIASVLPGGAVARYLEVASLAEVSHCHPATLARQIAPRACSPTSAARRALCPLNT